MNEPWSGLVYACDPGVGQEITTLHPALSIAFYFRSSDFDAIGQLYSAAMVLMKEHLTHYQAEEMKRPARITPQAFTMIPAWMKKPREGHVYWWTANGGADLGCSPPGFELSLLAHKRPTPAKALQRAENLKKWAEGENRTLGYRSNVRLVLPIDHPLAEGTALLDWLTSLDLVKRGELAFGECSYGLASMAAAFGGETQAREQAACSRYPGLDCFRGWHGLRLARVDHRFPEIVPSVKRAAWTVVLHEFTVSFLGGADAIRQQLADTPEIRVVPLDHGVILQAGSRPQLGDVSRGDYLPLVRKMARVLRPARTTLLAGESDFWDHFFDMFDKDFA
jgi:hypothetical protein